MYLDDGVSRESAPTNNWLAVSEVSNANGQMLQDAYGDPKAANKFREVVIAQKTIRRIDAMSGGWSDVREITITTPLPPGFTHSGYSDDLVRRDVGNEYSLAIWHSDDVDLETVNISTQECSVSYNPWTNKSAAVSLVGVPTGEAVKAVIKISNRTID
jgi:hypothetical protein